MKKVNKRLSFRLFFVAVAAVSIFSASAFSASAEGPEDLLDSFYGILPPDSGVGEGDSLSSAIGFEAILADIISALSGEGGGAFSFFLLLMGFAVIMAAAGILHSDDKISLKRNSEVAISAIGAVSIFSALFGVIAAVREGLTSVVDFFSELAPILTAISISGGSVASAGVQAVNINITLALIEKFCTGALLPLVFVLFSLALAASADCGGVAKVAKGVKNLFSWGIGIVSAILAAAVAMQSVVASAEDSASLRAARYAASGMIPIVGSAVSSVLATLAGGLAFIKSTVGVSSIVVIVSLALAPLISLLLYRLAFSFAVIFLEFAGSEGGVRCYSAFKSALDALIAVYSASVLICIVELVVFIKGGGAL